MNERQFILLLSIMVGFTSGLVAVFLKNMVHFIQFVIGSNIASNHENYLYFVYPGVGVLLTVILIKYIIKQKVGHGIPSTLFAISKKSARIPKHSTYASIFASMITVGFGGSVGLEGPTVGASSAIGSNFAQWGRMSYKIRTLMLGCGAAGAMSGIFNAPIAAIVFALEVIMLDLTAASLIPLLMASVSAALTSSFISGEETLFNIEVLEGFTLSDLPFYVLLGIFTGLGSVYFSKVYWFVENKFEKIEAKFSRVAVGALILGVMIFFFPPLYGEGLGTIKHLLNGNEKALLEGSFVYGYSNLTWVVLVFLVVVVFIKAIATSVTLGAGGVGGVFAPSLFIGSVIGFVFAKAINLIGWFGVSERNFTLVGMGGFIAGILHAPLTALFLIAEITGGYELVIPLMLTAALSFLTSKYFNPHSLYTMQLAKRGELITHNKDKAVLTLMKLQSEVEKDFLSVNPSDSLGELVKTVSHSKRNIFPVIDKEGQLEGIVLLDDIRQIMFDPKLYDKLLVKELMRDYPDSISSSESMDIVMQKFNKTGAWNLPVIDNGKYVGFVSKSKLFSAYRKVLQNFSDE
jgi:CIC family chloride channel protein